MALESIIEYPEVSFIEDLTLEELMADMIQDFQDKYKEITGIPVSLGKADPSRLILYACALQIYQGFQWVDNAGKQGLLKYSYGEFLENLGALKGISRSQGTYAQVTVKFTLSAAQQQVITIPAGTRVSPGDNIYFFTSESVEIPAGTTAVTVTMSCSELGIAGNDYEAGMITRLVDPVPYVASVSNIDTSSGGSDVESDESLAERIFLAPSRYSVAGPGDAYVYWAKTYNPGISDVMVISPEPVVVDIRFLMEGGALPETGVIKGLEEYLDSENIRPMTDLVQVSAPDVVSYTVNMQYWINASDRSMVDTIKEKVQIAIDNYIAWQQGKIGRDINPSVLNQMVISAGAKRTVITAPVYTVIPQTSVAQLSGSASVTYGGTEDD